MDVSQYLEIFIDETEEHLQTLSEISMVYRYICLSVVAGVERYAEREY